MKKLFATLLSLHLILAPVPALAAGGGGGIAKQILGIANSIVGSTVIVKCAMASMQPSLMVYMAGSLVYVASELAGGNKQKEQQKKQSQSLDSLKANMTEGGDYQKGAIDAQLKDEKDKLEVIQGRRKWMMATKAIYATATALAIYEWIRQFPPPPAGIGQGIPDIGACSPNPAANMPITAAIALAYSGISAYASSGVMGVASTMAVAAADFVFKLGIGASVADMTMTALNTALGRVAVFAAATALVMVVDGELAKEESETKKRIADLEKVKDQFYEQTGSGTKLAEGSSNSDIGADNQNGKDKDKNKYELKTLADGQNQKRKCFSTAKNATQYGEESCASPLKLTRPNMDPKFSVPTLVAAANTSTDLGQAIANGDMAAADVEAGKLAAMAGRIDAVRDNMMKKLNSDLKAQGQKPISIEDTLSTQLSAFNKALNEKKPGSGNYTMDDLGFGKGSNAGKAEVSAPDLASTKDGTQDINPVSSAPAGSEVPGAVAADLSQFENVSEDALSEDALGEYPFESQNVARLGSGSDDDKSASGEEISKERDVSIFKQVSNRYLLNYTKIFQRKEIKAPMAEAQGAQ